jgi:Dolichyl-phosphate-mannose-protein mannosyltransferase
MSDASQPAPAGGGPPSRGWRALLALATLCGAWLRLDQIGGQIIADDEWHSLHAVRDHSLAWILTHFGANDHGIPLTALDWLLAQTIGLSELGMRCVPLVAGIAALPLLARLLRPRIGERASLYFAWLLAFAPIEVLYSRMARPYEPVFVLTLLALLALQRWLAGGARAWAWVYACAAALAVWLHLVVAPFVFVPLLAGLRPGGAGTRGRAALARLGVLAACGTALLLAPALLGDFDSLQQRALAHAKGWPDAETSFQLFSGTFRPLCSFVFALAVLLGAFVLRRGHAWATGLVLASVAQVALVLLARPAVLEDPPVFVRYLLPVHGLWLLLAALGLERLDELARAEFRFLPRQLVGALLVALLYFGGPLRTLPRPCNWTNHQIFQTNYDPAFAYSFAHMVLGLQALPPVYAELARDARPGDVLVEAPWFAASHLCAYPVYQRVHRMPFRIGFVTPADAPLPLGELRAQDPRFRFANFANVAELEELRAQHVRFVVFHRDRPPNLDNPQNVDLRHVETWIARYRELVGPPRFEDARMAVFDLAPR